MSSESSAVDPEAVDEEAEEEKVDDDAGPGAEGVGTSQDAAAGAGPGDSSCDANHRDERLTPDSGLSQHRQQHQPRHHRLAASSLLSVGSYVCRICHTNAHKEPLVSPCRCKGTLAYVHLSCLERWLNQSCRSYCELCRFHFNAVETPRYRWPESLRIWLSHPRNRRNIQSDLLILTLLTVVTVGLVAVCLLGMRYFIIEGRKIGISKLWTRGAVWFFLTIVVLCYVTTVYLLAKDQVGPWYRWWRSTVNVRLVMESPLLSRRASGESLASPPEASISSSRQTSFVDS